MKLFIGFCLSLNLFLLTGCGGGVMDEGAPPEGDAAATEEPAELSEDEMDQENAANPDNVE
ncbi:hypothetical protein OAK91_03615 [Planctomycetaceae bacterium]|nr:hypothetical protein [bacterium]MDB4679447.1 hypothetical protein [Planctomycetaceae bacterium]MDC0273802.1 hypothetical protein [Planctomycetaceae bacterium]